MNDPGSLQTGNSAQPDISYARESLRKATHLIALVIPVVYSLTGKTIVLPALALLAFLFILFETARLRGWSLWKLVESVWGPLLRPNEIGKYSGASYILVGAILTIIAYDKAIAVCALTFIIIGDTAAAMVGRKWGHHRFKNKSYEGSAAFFFSSLIPVFVLSHSIPLWVGITGATVATVIEALSGKIDDNLTVPLGAGFVMQVAMRIFT